MSEKSLNIFVAGGFDPEDPNAMHVDADKIKIFAVHLGAEIIRQGHNLIGGCQTELDKIVAESAANELGEEDEDAETRIVSYVRPGVTPVTEIGVQIESSVTDWDLGGLQPTPPEVISSADVVILIGGFFGTFKAANWARVTGKPLLPFAIFGGAAREVFNVESTNLDKSHDSSVNKLDYDKVLKSMTRDYEYLATTTVSLAEKIVTTPLVFVVMSFTESAGFKDLRNSIERVCKSYEYDARPIDETNALKRIIPEIMRQLRQSAFVIADVTEAKPNVFYELGLADGLGKELILTAKKGTQLPFDIADIPVLFWDSFAEFEEELEKRVQHIGHWQGRR